MPDNVARSSRLWWLLIIPVLVVLAFGLKGAWLFLGLRSYKVSSSSMEKTIYAGDTVLSEMYFSLRRTPARGELVIFTHGEYMLVKRLIGMPGDRVQVKDGHALVDGVALAEPYAEFVGESSPALDNYGPTVVRADEVFVLGDNRNNSLDSRMDEFGAVHPREIFGKAFMVTTSSHHPLTLLH